MICSCIFSFQ